MGFYHSCQAIGSMMSGALQVAIIDTLHNAGGLAGWRWLFVINAVMTVVVGILGLFLLPDLPNNINPRAFWFKKGHAKLAMERLERHGRAEPKKMSWGGAKYDTSVMSHCVNANWATGERSLPGWCILSQSCTFPRSWHRGDTLTSTCS
jgi:MFS family permease